MQAECCVHCRQANLQSPFKYGDFDHEDPVHMHYRQNIPARAIQQLFAMLKCDPVHVVTSTIHACNYIFRQCVRTDHFGSYYDFIIVIYA